MEYDSLSRCLGGEMVDTRDSKSRAKERGVRFEIIRPAPPRIYASTRIKQRRLLAFQPSFSFRDLSEKKENSVLLGREYVNRTNRPVDLFASEQNNSN
ncbi:hypothetical protein VNO77_51012 [Canavalia gladiata]